MDPKCRTIHAGFPSVFRRSAGAPVGLTPPRSHMSSPDSRAPHRGGGRAPQGGGAAGSGTRDGNTTSILLETRGDAAPESHGSHTRRLWPYPCLPTAIRALGTDPSARSPRLALQTLFAVQTVVFDCFRKLDPTPCYPSGNPRASDRIRVEPTVKTADSTGPDRTRLPGGRFRPLTTKVSTAAGTCAAADSGGAAVGIDFLVLPFTSRSSSRSRRPSRRPPTNAPAPDFVLDEV